MNNPKRTSRGTTLTICPTLACTKPTAARKLDHEHSLQPDGTPYPEPNEQRQRGLDGPVLLALRSYAPVQGLVVGSWQGASEAVHALAREAADACAEGRWRLMGDVRTQDQARGIFLHDIRQRWGATFWRSWARLMRARLPCVGQPDDRRLRAGDAQLQLAGGPQLNGAWWPRQAPGLDHGARAQAGG